MTQISAKIIAHSKSTVNGKEIVTFELEYPRFIHSELMTHRLFSRNAASSRAIPVEKMIEQVRTDFASPVHWGKNQPGMQAKEELVNPQLLVVKNMWEDGAFEAAYIASKMVNCGAHKQIVNRILEPYQWMKTIVTATEFDNFFWLRNHEDAQPEIKRLAEVMLEALKNSVPFELNAGEWHVPYVERTRNFAGKILYFVPSSKEDSEAIPDVDRDIYVRLLELENALKVSSSCCAQVSYRKLDDSLEKAQMVYKRLVESEPVHASPFEHQSTPMFKTEGPLVYKAPKGDAEVGTFSFNKRINNPTYAASWQDGVTHVDKEGRLWSGNFCGWIQHRQLIPNNVCKKYEE